MLKDIDLTWKINMIITILMLIIIAILSFIIYNSTSIIVFNQIDDKINIMTSNQKKLLNEIMKRKKEEINLIAKDSIISLYTDFAYNIKHNQGTAQKDRTNFSGIYNFDELINATSLVRHTGNRLMASGRSGFRTI